MVKHKGRRLRNDKKTKVGSGADHSQVGLDILYLYGAVRLKDWAETLGGGFKGVSGELWDLSWSSRSSGVDITCRGRMVSHGTRFIWHIYHISVSMLLERM